MDRLLGLEETIIAVDRSINFYNDTHVEASGSTLVSVVVDEKMIYCGNVGDARAVLCRGKKAIQMSVDHKPYLEDEKKRIVANGGFVQGNYMISRKGEALAVSRAIGDVAFRKGACDFLISTPSMAQFEKSSEDDFIVLASDGLFDVMKNQEVCDFVLKCLKEGSPFESIAKQLTVEAVARKSMDNVTVIVVFFLDDKLGIPRGYHSAALELSSSRLKDSDNLALLSSGNAHYSKLNDSKVVEDFEMVPTEHND